MGVGGFHGRIPKAEIKSIIIVEIFMVHIMIGGGIQPFSKA
jgi:hypothetical protein